MTWQEITDQEIETGEPVKSSTASKLKNNLVNLQERIAAVEQGGNTVYPPIIMAVRGAYGESGDLEIPALNLAKTTLNFNLTITGVRLIIDQAGESGATEIDIKYKRGGGDYTSIFTTKPTVAFGAGNDATSTNAVLDQTHVNLQAADILRLDLTAAQKRAKNFLVRIDYAKT